MSNDSDDLTSITSIENENSPDEEMTMNGIFGKKPEKKKFSVNWKKIALTILSFALVANPWIDTLLEKLPYTENSVMILLYKILIFSILLVVIDYFC